MPDDTPRDGGPATPDDSPTEVVRAHRSPAPTRNEADRVVADSRTPPGDGAVPTDDDPTGRVAIPRPENTPPARTDREDTAAPGDSSPTTEAPAPAPAGTTDDTPPARKPTAYESDPTNEAAPAGTADDTPPARKLAAYESDPTDEAGPAGTAEDNPPARTRPAYESDPSGRAAAVREDGAVVQGDDDPAGRVATVRSEKDPPGRTGHPGADGEASVPAGRVNVDDYPTEVVAVGGEGLVPGPSPAGDETAGGSTAEAPGDTVETGGLVTATAGAGEDRPITAESNPVARTSLKVPEHIRALQQEDGATPDPLLDIEQRKLEAGVDKMSPFGRPGQPMGTAHPFVFGFTAALGVISAWLLVQAIISARQVIVLIVVSMFLAIGLNPAVERLQRARLPRGGAVALVFFGLVAAFVGIGFAVVPPLTDGVTDFVDHLPNYIQQLQDNPRIKELDQKHQLLQKARDAVTDEKFGKGAFNGVVGVGKVVLSGIFSMFTILILTLYFLSSLPVIKTFFYRLAPRSRRARVALLGDEILLRIGGYVAGTITVAFIAGTVAYIFLMIMEVPFALPLALLVGITALIPLVGATLGAVLVCTVAFFEGTWTGIICVIFFVVYQQVENYLIHPRVMKRAVDVQPAVTIIAALIGGTLLGIVGALLAIPTAAAIALIVREVVVPRQENL